MGGVPHRVDVTRPDDMAALADAARDACLVCLNAGVLGRTMGAPWEADATEWERVLRINLMGVVDRLRMFVPRLVDVGNRRRSWSPRRSPARSPSPAVKRMPPPGAPWSRWPNRRAWR